MAQSSETAGLKAQLEQIKAQMQAPQQVMQRMQDRLNDPEVNERVHASAPKPEAQAPPLVSPATAPAPTTQPPYRLPSALAGASEPLPDGYVGLGDTGNLRKLDLVAQLDAMVDSPYMGVPDLFVPSSIPVRGQPFYDSGRRSNTSTKQSIFRVDFRRETYYGTLKVVYKNNFFGSGDGDLPYNLQAFYGELDNDRCGLLAGYNISSFTDITFSHASMEHG